MTPCCASLWHLAIFSVQESVTCSLLLIEYSLDFAVFNLSLQVAQLLQRSPRIQQSGAEQFVQRRQLMRQTVEGLRGRSCGENVSQEPCISPGGLTVIDCRICSGGCRDHGSGVRSNSMSSSGFSVNAERFQPPILLFRQQRQVTAQRIVVQCNPLLRSDSELNGLCRRRSQRIEMLLLECSELMSQVGDGGTAFELGDKLVLRRRSGSVAGPLSVSRWVSRVGGLVQA